MQVFKFGGASVKDAAAITRAVDIIDAKCTAPTAIVISAIGKTTNHLEAIVWAWHKGEPFESLLDELKSKHLLTAEELLPAGHEVFAVLGEVFGEIERSLDELDRSLYDLAYDQVVSQGEMLSTKIISAKLADAGVKNAWSDARSFVSTNSSFREARVRWDATADLVKGYVEPALLDGHVITQGFIGRDTEGFTTTLGREGSDFTASILAYCLDAESVTVWKDVPGVLNADPRFFKEAVKIDRLSYRDAIEMTYYGAQVIHPKTIKPLQNKRIPLHVKPFDDPDAPGTVIRDQQDFSLLPPVIVVKPDQVLLNISTKDFSFIAEDNLGFIYASLGKNRIRANMSSNSAISFTICFDKDPSKLEHLLADLETDYNVDRSDNLKLTTVIHYNEGVLQQVRASGEVVVEEKVKGTAQLLVK